MMWDLGGGTYVPGSAEPLPQPPYPRPLLDTYAFPPSPTEPAPFHPIGGPSPQFPSPGSVAHSYSYSQAYSPSMQHVQHSRSIVTTEVRHTHRHNRPHVHTSDTRQRSIPQVSQTQTPHRHTGFGHILFSNCTGKKKAVCIGINYFGTREELHGCINDAKNVRKFLIRHHNYKAENVLLLTDEPGTHPNLRPTKQNIMNVMHWLVHGARQHDALFFHFSGHGSQVKDKDGDEVDGYDEVIFPVDYKNTGVITDDEMHLLMVKPLVEGCRLTALFDSCHSGSVLDLPYLYHTNGRVKGSQVTPSHIEEKSTFADVISWSGCNDDQTSADTTEAGVAVGAMSYAFMKSMRENPKQSYQDLLRNIRAILRDKYKQKPQLSSSHRIDTTHQFIM